MKTIYKIALLLAVLAVIYFFYDFDKNRKAGKENIEKEDKVIFNYNPDDISALRMNTGKDEFYAEKDRNGRWLLKKPFEDGADELTISGILDKVLEIEATKKIKPEGGDLSAYGLKTPSSGFVFYNSDLKPVVSVEIGEQSVVTDVVYIRINNEEDIFMVSPAIKRAIMHSAYEMRAKHLLQIPSNEISRIEITVGGKENYSVKKYKDLWEIVSPVKCKADDKNIYGYMNLLNNVVVKQFVIEKATKEDLKKYGLDVPEIKLAFYNNGGKVFEASLSKEKIGSGMYAVSNMRDGIYYIEESIIQNLPLKLINLRPLKIMPFGTADIEAMQLKNKRGEIFFKKDPRGIWTGSVSGKSINVDILKVKVLESIVTNVAAKKFVEGPVSDLALYGFNNPQAEVTLFGAQEKKLGRFIIGKHDSEGLLVYCKNGDSSDVALIDSILFRDYLGREPEFYFLANN